MGQKEVCEGADINSLLLRGMNSSKRQNEQKTAKPASGCTRCVWARSAYLSLPHPCANPGQSLKSHISAPNPASSSHGQQTGTGIPVSCCWSTAKAAGETCLFLRKIATRLQSKVKTPNTPCPKICRSSGIPCIAPTLVILQRDDAK